LPGRIGAAPRTRRPGKGKLRFVSATGANWRDKREGSEEEKKRATKSGKSAISGRKQLAPKSRTKTALGRANAGRAKKRYQRKTSATPKKRPQGGEKIQRFTGSGRAKRGTRRAKKEELIGRREGEGKLGRAVVF